MSKRSRYLNAKEATTILGISPATLYAYVSRGLVRSEAAGEDSRVRRYHAEDVEKLRLRQEQRKNPAAAVQDALHWGTPILESGLTLIADERLYYRGEDALELALAVSVEEIAALFWTGSKDLAASLFVPLSRSQRYLNIIAQLPTNLSTMQRLQLAVTLASGDDVAAYDLRPERVAQTGARILHLLTAVLSGQDNSTASIVNSLARGWHITEEYASHLFTVALILCTDHELNVSSFTARVVASAESNPYLVVLAGLAALQGALHGGNTLRVEALMREALASSHPDQVIVDRLRRGERIPGFGHRLYPEGDPRAQVLLQQIEQNFSASPIWLTARQLIATVKDAVDQHPNIDFALALLTTTLSLPPDSGIALFALGRTIGWIGHAIEQYQTKQLIRPRAIYTGNLPPTEG